MVDDAGCAVGQAPGRSLAVGTAAVAVEPLNSARNVGERNSILCVGVELGSITDDQPFVRADPSSRRKHGDVELTVGRTGVVNRVIDTPIERGLARDRG